MRIVFAGTPDFAVPCLQAAARHNEVVAVYTQPDRPAGRGRGLTASPVKQAALERGLPVYQPLSLRDPAAQAELAALQPDLLVVVAYGLILPQAVLDIPTHGCWNVHASLLPRWRGAAPIQRAIQAGDSHSGVCLMQMEAGLDTGPVLLEQSLELAADETGGSLHDKLAALGAQVLADGLGLLRAGLRPVARPQPAEGVEYAHKLDKAEARLQWSEDAQVLERQVRAEGVIRPDRASRPIAYGGGVQHMVVMLVREQQEPGFDGARLEPRPDPFRRIDQHPALRSLEEVAVGLGHAAGIDKWLDHDAGNVPARAASSSPDVGRK